MVRIFSYLLKSNFAPLTGCFAFYYLCPPHVFGQMPGGKTLAGFWSQDYFTGRQIQVLAWLTAAYAFMATAIILPNLIFAAIAGPHEAKRHFAGGKERELTNIAKIFVIIISLVALSAFIAVFVFIFSDQLTRFDYIDAVLNIFFVAMLMTMTTEKVIAFWLLKNTSDIIHPLFA